MNTTMTPLAPTHRLNAIGLSIVLATAALAGCGPKQAAAPGETVAAAPSSNGGAVPRQPAMTSIAQPGLQAPPIQEQQQPTQAQYSPPQPAPSRPAPVQPMATAQTAYGAQPQVYQRAGQPVPPAAPVYQSAPPVPAYQSTTPPVVVAQAYPQSAAPAPRVYRQPVAARAPVHVASDHVGRVASIEPIRERPQGSGAGGVLGGVLGAVVGNQFGHGNGRAALTVLGGVGGAVAGNNVERNVKERVVGYRISVVTDDGGSRTYEESNTEGLRVGDRVRVDGGGLRRI